MAASDRYPALLPTRAQIDAERALTQQSAKEGRELDQGLFIAQVLADERCGMHLIHAMLKPKREALDRLAEFRNAGFVDLGEAKVERKGKVGHVTLTNAKFLNAEDDRATAALETAVDLVLLDDTIEVGVLRGGTVQHPKYAGRRIFNAGINLTHLYYGQISLTDFFIERELGLLHKIFAAIGARNPTTSNTRTTSRSRGSRPSRHSPSAAAASFSVSLIAYSPNRAPTSICRPAKKDLFPVRPICDFRGWWGSSSHREGIFFERVFPAETPEGRMICDEVVAAGEMDMAIETNALQLGPRRNDQCGH